MPYLGWFSPFCYGGSYGYYDAYSPYYSDTSVLYSYQPSTVTNEIVVTEPAVVAEVPAVDVQAVEKPVAISFAEQGEIDFKAGVYDAAIRNWQHALLDDPGNGALVLLLGQAFFASGKYDEAAGATQQALQSLPQDKWDLVLRNRADLYPDDKQYQDQLKALEAALETNDSPALHFLVGYHHAFIGDRVRASRELAKTLEMVPQDEIAKTLHDLVTGKPVPAGAAAAPAAPDLVLPPLPGNQ